MPTSSSVLPELVFGLVGPMGVNIDAICETLATALKAVNYETHIIHLTKEMLEGARYTLQRYPVRERMEKNLDKMFARHFTQPMSS